MVMRMVKETVVITGPWCAIMTTGEGIRLSSLDMLILLRKLHSINNLNSTIRVLPQAEVYFRFCY